MLKRLFIKLLYSFFLGIFISVFVFQNSYYMRAFFAFHIKNYLESFTESTVNCCVKNINIFSPQLLLSDVSFSPLNHNNWSWHCSNLNIHFSWLDFLLYGTIALDIDIYDARADSLVDGFDILIAKHLAKFYEGTSTIPIFLRSCCLHTSSIILYDKTEKNSIDFFANVDIKKSDDVIKCLTSIYNGKAVINNKVIYQNLYAKVRSDIILQSKNSNCIFDLDGTAYVPHFINNETTYFSGTWQYDHGFFSVNNQDRSFIISPIKLYTFGKNLVVNLFSHMPLNSLHKDLFGTVMLSCNSEIHKKNVAVSGAIVGKNLRYKKNFIGHLNSCTFKKVKDLWKGQSSFAYKQNNYWKGSWTWNEKESRGFLKVENETPFAINFFPYWSFLPQSSSFSLMYDSVLGCQANYLCKAIHQKNKMTFVTDGQAKLKDNDFLLRGKYKNNSYYLSSKVLPKIKLKKCCYKDKSSGKKIKFIGSKNNIFKGTIDFDLIRKGVKSLFDIDLQAEGRLQMEADMDDEHVYLKSKVINGTVRLPYTYNFIDNFIVDIVANLKKRVITINNIKCSLCKGLISLNDGIIHYNKFFTPTFIYAPLLLNNFLIHRENNFYTLFSGALQYIYNVNNINILSGNIFLNDTCLDQSILSYGETANFRKFNIDDKASNIVCDIAIETKNPVIFKTKFLKTKADVDVTVWGPLTKPAVSGDVTLRSGILYFPYKPLYIKRGIVNFLPGKLWDPLIELNAKNKLKKYMINLNVTGSALFPHISLSSLPKLSEEQIIGLLLVGSEKESLYSLVPAIVMKNIKNILPNSFKESQSKSSHFKKLLKSFKKVHFVPSFADQTARGGLRGLVEIDINDQWRASLQKNFNLSEDTRFELEYCMSDEVSIQAIRNERGDVTANMQMRWKF